jgi:nitrogen regulatory protein P-II 1
VELFVLVVKETRFLDDILTGFVDIGVHGATVVDSRGMGQILTAEVPIFAGLRDLMPGGNIGSHLILSVMDEKQVDKAIQLVEETCGSFSEEGIGVIFTVPVRRFYGYSGRRGSGRKQDV